MQVSTPPEICEMLHIHPGQELEILIREGHIHLIPVPTIESLRGILKDSNEAFVREKYDATLWTQDDDFAAIPGVRYFPKPKP